MGRPGLQVCCGARGAEVADRQAALAPAHWSAAGLHCGGAAHPATVAQLLGSKCRGGGLRCRHCGWPPGCLGSRSWGGLLPPSQALSRGGVSAGLAARRRAAPARLRPPAGCAPLYAPAVQSQALGRGRGEEVRPG